VPRKSRVQSPGYYHVAARGNDRQVIFDDVIRELFLHKLSRTSRACTAASGT
jgi:hypothetical protein